MYYLISKILPLLILPLGLSLILICIALIRHSRWPGYIAFIILSTFSIAPVSNLLSKLVEYPWKPIADINAPNADAIVVLSGGVPRTYGTGALINWEFPERFWVGIELFRKGKAPKIIFTGGTTPFNRDSIQIGNMYIKEALSLGINSNYLISTGPATNTIQEADQVSELLDSYMPNSKKRILLVTSAFHMTRAQDLFQRKGLVVLPFPVSFNTYRNRFKTLTPNNPIAWIPQPQSLQESSRALKELLARIVYRTW